MFRLLLLFLTASLSLGGAQPRLLTRCPADFQTVVEPLPAAVGDPVLLVGAGVRLQTVDFVQDSTLRAEADRLVLNKSVETSAATAADVGPHRYSGPHVVLCTDASQPLITFFLFLSLVPKTPATTTAHKSTIPNPTSPNISNPAPPSAPNPAPPNTPNPAPPSAPNPAPPSAPNSAPLTVHAPDFPYPAPGFRNPAFAAQVSAQVSAHPTRMLLVLFAVVALLGAVNIALGLLFNYFPRRNSRTFSERTPTKRRIYEEPLADSCNNAALV